MAIRHNLLIILLNGSSTNFGKQILEENQMSTYFNWMPKQLNIRPALGKYFVYCVDELFRFEKRKTEDIMV
jgi:hypothetical protein